ncbi:hypothetical protein ACJJIF_07155 [Microbulbifer sp. SSSA002]|uniref:hypothetical protein n=1 Tax=Microbulbifer sp. SSSA002 TaxID=3243376 RepID=UPI00403A0BFA
MANELEQFQSILNELDGPSKLDSKFARLSQLPPGSEIHNIEKCRSELKAWKLELQGSCRVARIAGELLESSSFTSTSDVNLRDVLILKAGKKLECAESYIEATDARIEFVEDLLRGMQEKEQKEFTKRTLSEAERANSIAKEGLRIAADSSAAAEVSASAAKQSAQVAGDGVKLTKKMFWAAVVSALVAVGALIGQIYSQNKDVSVNLSSPVALQPVTLSDESISNLTHAIAVELTKAKGQQVILSAESIEGLLAALKLELESSARIDVVETKEKVEQKAN